MIQRGKVPEALAEVRTRYTPKWVAFYERKTGKKPTDTKWRTFEPTLRERFVTLCGYCEELCKGEVDHFRPKSVFPREVYVWDNWVYACHTCNNSKGEEWIATGYIDPCATRADEHPERFFEFDTKTGEILPKKGLSKPLFDRAVNTRDDLKLNAYHHLKERVLWLKVIEQALGSNGASEESRAALVALVTSRETKLSSIARTFIAACGISIPY